LPKQAGSKRGLTATDQVAIEAADFQAVEAAAVRVRANLTGSSRAWLSAGNKYGRDVVQEFKRTAGTSDPELEEYLAASVLLHCLDGWAYLGRALSAHTSGDPASALHLAYYGELRAAMTILGSRGIGVLDSDHFVLDTTSSIQRISGIGTHPFVWHSFKYWSGTTAAADFLGNAVQWQGITLKDWLAAINPGSGAGKALGQQWLRLWGLDLSAVGDDRRRRNQASYRPTGLTRAVKRDFGQVAEILESIWRPFEPSAQSFPLIDMYLIRAAIWASYEGVAKPGMEKDQAEFAAFLDQGLNSLGLDPAIETFCRSFFPDRISHPDPWILTSAASVPSGGAPTQYLGVLARAAMLLRVAIAAAFNVSRGGAFSAKHLAFWWEGISVDRAFRDPVRIPSSSEDMWSDVSEALDELAVWSSGAPPSLGDKQTWSHAKAKSIFVLAGAERIALWGLAS